MLFTSEIDAAEADELFVLLCDDIGATRGPVQVELAGLTFVDVRSARALGGARSPRSSTGKPS